MNILIRSFNPNINSKTGVPLPPGQTRGTPEWFAFEVWLESCLQDLGHHSSFQMENPRVVDTIPEAFKKAMDIGENFKRIYVHKCKREVPHGDLFYMQMHMRNLFTIDKNGWGVDHSDYKECPGFPDQVPDEAIEWAQEWSDKLLISGLSKCEQPKETSATPPRFILAPLQTPRDYTIRHHSPITVKYFIESLSAWAEETKNHVAFKLHPFNKHDHDLIEAVEYGCQSRYVHKVEGNIHEIIKRSDGVFVINSGTGFEALIHGKPVASFGACDYNRVTFNADIRRLDEARNFIYSYKPDFQNLGYKFIWWYCHRHAYDLNDPEMQDRLTRYLKGALE